MTVVVADACPVILLAKLDRLSLIREVFPGSILVPTSVRRELLHDAILSEELRRIQAFLKHCRVEAVRISSHSASALSLADRHVLSLAKRHPQSLVLTDDRLVRRVALAEGLTVAGTLGVIIRASRSRILTQTEALQAVDKLVTQHQLRISVSLYQEAIGQIRTPRLASLPGSVA